MTAPADETGTCPACAGAMPVHHMGAPLQAAHALHPAARPAEPPRELREALAEWLFRYNRGPLTFWHEISEVAKDSRRDDADQLLSGPLAPLLADQAAWRELLRQVVMDWVPECNVPDCACSAHRARRALDGPQ